jgi:uncharacterized protein YccT (UPF0319 family)
VILFEAEDETLTLSAPDITTRRGMTSFNEIPDWIFRNNAGKDHEFHMDVLEKTGFQVVRNYEQEISEFNKGRSQAAWTGGDVSTVPHSNAAAAAETISSGKSVEDQETVRQMLRYWYSKADEETRSEMKHWIVSGE